MMRLMLLSVMVCLAGAAGFCDGEPLVEVGVFAQERHEAHTTAQGLPDNDVRRVWVGATGEAVAETAGGTAVFDGTRWVGAPERTAPATLTLEGSALGALEEEAGGAVTVWALAEHGGETAAATDKGLFLKRDGEWRMALPRQGTVRWAPVDVRAVAYDGAGRLWFASPQGVGCREDGDGWRLYTGAEGLPFNDFTCMTAGAKAVWFGTTNGAVRFEEGVWSFRQGRRWLLDNHVRGIAVDGAGDAWIATAGGVSRIMRRPMTLAEKAAFYREEIERHHRRTRFGYVNPAVLATPGDKDTATPVFTDNDGHFTGLYLAAVSLGYAATGEARLREDAARAFRALAFLSEVTAGGTHPAPRGFIARCVKPTSEADPNPDFDLAYDQRRNKADALWKIIQPRWPVDATGEWYWKNDSSSDELDGHFFGFAVYFDRVCATEEERETVRGVVRRIMDHVLDNGYNLVDHDGQPTRWGRFSPDDLNRNSAWCDERGLNSLSILTYLSIAHHITGDQRYRDEYLKLALDEGYAMNGMTQPTPLPGPGGAGHQPDDNMAFMNYYHLIRYETDPKLLNMHFHAIHTHWRYERIERNPFANYVYGACCQGKTRTDQWGTTDLTPPEECHRDAADTLRRFPLDLLDWPMSNAHRIDMRPLANGAGGGGVDGRVFPIDERHEVFWDMNPWALEYKGDGTRLREGTPFLLAYYLGLAHGFVR